MIVSGDGKFRFENVPHDEPMTFYARVPGYRLASERNRFQQVSEDSIAMLVEGPREDIEIYFEPVPGRGNVPDELVSGSCTTRLAS